MSVIRVVCVAYSTSLRHGRNHHARAFGEETGNPGLPADYTFRTGAGVANDEKSASRACRYAVARFLRDNPEYCDAPIFSFGRVSDEVLSASAVRGLRGRNRCSGVALEFANAGV